LLIENKNCVLIIIIIFTIKLNIFQFVYSPDIDLKQITIEVFGLKQEQKHETSIDSHEQ